jgi:acyl-CoA synthetase (AMP-forming)/AMP-acid ligase II
MNVISDLLNASYNAAPEKIAIIDDNSKLSYSELYDEVNRLSSYLNQFPQKSVISLLFDNTNDFVVSYLGVVNSGCIAHLIPTGISLSNLTDQILSAKPILILSSDNYFSKFSEIKLENIKKIKFSDIITKSSNTRNPKPSDYAYLIYTSGTTSSPKGVPITHSNTIFTTNNIVKKLNYNKNDVNLLPLSLSHSFGLGCLHTSLHVGSTLILQKNADISKIINSIEKNNVSTLAAIPSTLSKIVSNSNSVLNKLSNLRLIITNSTFFPPETIKNLNKILTNGKVATYYGLTEASRSTFMIFDDDDKLESVGKPSEGVSIKLISDETTSSIGEIWIKGSNVIEKYWNDEHTTANISDGWLKTGDLGKIEDDYLYILGRIDDLINVSGQKVYPQEIERVVKVLSGIEDVIAVPMKHELFGEVVKLFVKKSKESKILKTDILAHCIKNLERYKVPAKIEFVEDFPRTDYGKIKRFMLK